MQKIVIVNSNNGCTFSLSTKVIRRYFELSNLGKPYFYIRDYSYLNITKYKKIEDADDYFYTSFNDLGKELTNENNIFDKENYFDQMEILRDDVNLVKAVEEINPDEIKIVEIPDDVEWYIREEDDGHESIEGTHRSWF